jgi:hypothetical protein
VKFWVLCRCKNFCWTKLTGKESGVKKRVGQWSQSKQSWRKPFGNISPKPFFFLFGFLDKIRTTTFVFLVKRPSIWYIGRPGLDKSFYGNRQTDDTEANTIALYLLLLIKEGRAKNQWMGVNRKDSCIIHLSYWWNFKSHKVGNVSPFKFLKHLKVNFVIKVNLQMDPSPFKIGNVNNTRCHILRLKLTSLDEVNLDLKY